MKIFDRTKIKTVSLSERKNKLDVEKLVQRVKDIGEVSDSRLDSIAKKIIFAKENKKPVILFFGAHLIKNGLGPFLGELIEKGYITHVATNGAGSIHDWEFAYQGKSGEDVRERVSRGMFGMGEETGKFINLAVQEGSRNNRGYGESVGKMIAEDQVFLNNEESELIKHPWKRYSLQYYAFENKIPFTVHPGFGYDIIYTNPLVDGGSFGRVAERDFLYFVESISNLDEGGVYLSVGSAIASPMVFEKSLSMARNVSLQDGRDIKDFSIIVNDIADEKSWDFGTGKEPSEDDPAYYSRLCKSFDRMGSKNMSYVKMDNREFIKGLYDRLMG